MNGWNVDNVWGAHSNATFVFPPAGNHAWPYWAQQLQALKPDLIATLNG
jgi:diacylglycerol O-acyltransferase / trehalose O-mycolyltransferase